MAKDKNLYELVDEHCNAEQVRDLLREFKDRSDESKEEIRLTGNKPDLIENLRRAVSLDLVPRDRAVQLLRDSEENGHQHILYYRAKRGMAAAIRNYESIVEELIGEEWDESYPMFTFIPDKFQWVDFRRDVHGKPRDWIFKAYGQESYFKHTDTKHPSETRRIEIFDAEITRATCLVRWNDPDLLEIRIDSRGLRGRGHLVEREAKIWKLLEPALTKEQFAPWDLSPVQTYVALHRNDGDGFSIRGDLKLVDREDGVIIVKCQTDEESIDDLLSRKIAVDGLLADGAAGHGIRVEWSMPPENPQDKTWLLSTKCGANFDHELIIGAKVSASAVDYVTNRLRELEE